MQGNNDQKNEVHSRFVVETVTKALSIRSVELIIVYCGIPLGTEILLLTYK